MKTLFAALIAITLSFSALAAPASVTGTIDLVSPPAPTYGDTVEFAVEVTGKQKPNSVVFVRLVCRTGGSAIYQSVQLAPSDWLFDLSFEQWLDWDTDCVAELVYREYSNRYWAGRIDYYLDTVEFPLVGP